MLQSLSATCPLLWKIAKQFSCGHPELLSPQPKPHSRQRPPLGARLALVEVHQFVPPAELYRFEAVPSLQFR